MTDDSLILWLALATLLIAIVLAVWQLRRVSRAKREHTHSAITAGRPDQRATDGAPGVPPQR